MRPITMRSRWWSELRLDMIEAKPENLIGDKAYDSDALDEELKEKEDGDDRAASGRTGN